MSIYRSSSQSVLTSPLFLHLLLCILMCIFSRLSSSHSTLQLTAFAFRDYVRFGYVDQGDTHNTRLLRQFNINTYAPTMLLFKEDTEKPVDIIQV